MDFLLYMAALKGLTKDQAKRKAKELLQLVALEDVAKKKIKTERNEEYGNTNYYASPGSER